MAIGDDFAISTAGAITHASGSTNYTVLELHRWLQDLADDAALTGDDFLDITTTTPSSEASRRSPAIMGPQPGTHEYQKMLAAYGFPQWPHPIPAGMDPAYHVQLLMTDASYRARYEKERSEREKAFKEQIDRDNLEKDRKAGVKIGAGGAPEDLSRGLKRESAGGGGISGIELS